MLKKITKLLICLFVLICFTGCSTKDSAANEIERLLYERYDKEFTVYALGGRNAASSTIQAYVYANDNPTMLFTVRINENDEIEYEDYAHRLVARKTETMINSAFVNYGIDTVCHVSYSPQNFELNQINITPSDYIKANNIESLIVALVVRDGENVNGENIERVYKQVHSQLDNIFIGTEIYVVSSDDYDRVSEKVILETQDFDEYRLKLKGIEDPIRKMIFQVSNGSLTKTSQEIEDALLN